MTLLPIDEPVASTAALALRLASTLCHKDPATGESCAWYHGPWQLLRLLGLVMTPARHADFYGMALEAAASRGSAPRVLISGAADYSLLGHVLAALRARSSSTKTTSPSTSSARIRSSVASTRSNAGDWSRNGVSSCARAVR